MFNYFIVLFGKVILKVIYLFIKIFPQRDKIVFISRQSNDISYDFLVLKNQIKKTYPEIEIKIMCRTLGQSFSDRFRYLFHMISQMYHIATAKVVVLDSYCIVVSILNHKKNLKVVQIWHALGLMKKFGHATVGTAEGSDASIAKIMKMHNNYDYIVCSSPEIKGEISEAYGTSEDKIIPLGLPRCDYLTDENMLNLTKKEIYGFYNELNNGKKTILYVPTFRKEGSVNYKSISKSINYDLFNLVIKFHDGKEMIFTKDKVIRKNSKFKGFNFIAIADFVISDYSAIIFEVLIAKRPLFLYCYDIDSYFENRGLFIDYYTIPAIISKNAEEIISQIENYDLTQHSDSEFIKKYVTYTNVNITNALSSLITNCLYNREINFNELISNNLKK